MPNGVEFEGRLAHVGTFPIGIEPDSFIDVRVHWQFTDLLKDDLMLKVMSESTKAVRQGPHSPVGAAIWRSEGHRWCGSSRLHKGSSSKAPCDGIVPYIAPRMDRQSRLMSYLGATSDPLLSGCACSTCGSFTSGRGGIPKPSVDSEWACWKNQWAVRYRWVHAYPFYAQESRIRRTLCLVCCQWRLFGHEHQGRYEFGLSSNT